jgi:short-subunit dehydrogenase
MPKRTLAGKRILITGASMGIGYALAAAAAKRGAKVVAVARSFGLLEELARQVQAVGGQIDILAADVTNPADRQNLAEFLHTQHGGLDILINNAGVGATGHFVEVDESVLREIFEVNYFGALELTRLCLPLLARGQQPLLVNISSILGRRAYPARSYYSASKFALTGWSDAVRAELSPHGVGVLVVNPGLTVTNFSANMKARSARLPMDHLRGMSADDVAEATMKAMEADKAEINLTLQGKLMVLVNRFIPWFFEWRAKKTIQKLFADELPMKTH